MGQMFLDEIGDMRLTSRRKVLRALQDRCEQWGGPQRQGGVRILAATHTVCRPNRRGVRRTCFSAEGIHLVRRYGTATRIRVARFHAELARAYGRRPKRLIGAARAAELRGRATSGAAERHDD